MSTVERVTSWALDVARDADTEAQLIEGLAALVADAIAPLVRCNSLGASLLLTDTFVEQLDRDDLCSLGTPMLKGIEAPPRLYTLQRMAPIASARQDAP